MGRIQMDIDFGVNKASVAEVKKALQDFQNQINNTGKNYGFDDKLKKASESAKELNHILNDSWNTKLNQLDLSKLNNSINKTFGSVSNLKNILENSGSGGAVAFNTFSRAILNTNLQLSKSNKLLDDMADTMTKTVKWGIASSIFNNITNSIQKAYDYTVKLDTSLNDIRIVTGKSADEMNRFAVQANRVAKDLGKSTKDFTEASLIYYQQGLGNEEAQARAEVTLKAANVTGQTGQEVSEQLTAVWNGYKVTADETELYVDKLAAVAATTASDLEELSTGMSKVASAANLMGVDIDQLNAQLATIVSVTKQAPESVGVALKTIYARMGDIKAGLDDETTLGNYTSKMAELGFNVLDVNGNLRDMGKVIEEIGGKWTQMSREQQIALSQTMAGTRQYNNLLSLFDNWDMYTKALETSANAAGTLQEQQDIYMESTAAHLKQLSTEAERTYDILFDQDTVNGFTDTLTSLLDKFNDFIAGLGGGTDAFIYFGSVATNIFKKQIASGINDTIDKIEKMKQNAASLNLMRDIVNEGKATDVDQPQYVDNDLERAEELLQIQKYISNEEFNELNTLRQQVTEYDAIIEALENIKVKNKDNLTFKQAEDQYKESAKNYEIQIASKNKILNLAEKINQVEKRGNQENKKEAIKNLQEEIGLLKTYYTQGEQNKNLKIIENTLKEKGKISEEQINTIIKLEDQTIVNLNKKQLERLALAKAIKAVEDGTEKDLYETYNKYLAIYNTKIDSNKRKGEITDLVQGLSTLTGLLTSISGIVKTLNNEDLTIGEKAEQIISVLIGNLPLLLMNLKSLKGLLPAIAGATNKAAIAMGAEGVTAASGFGASLMGVIKVAGPYALAIGAIVGAIYLLVKASKAEQEEIDKLKEAATALSEKSKEVKSNIESINNDFDKYKSALSTLESCTEKTQEWDSALKEVNTSALAILDKYPDLAKIPHLFSRIDGALTLNQSVLDDYLEKQERSAAIIQSASLMTSSIASNRQAKKDTEDLINEIQSSIYTTDQRYTSYANTGQYNNIDTKEIKRAVEIVSNNLKDLSNLTESEYKARLVDLDINGKYIETLMEYQDKIDELGNETENAAIQMRNTADAIAAIAIGDKGASTNTQTAMYSEQYQNEVSNRQEELYNKYTGWGISKASGGDNSIYQEMLEQLQKVEGFENFKSNQNGVRGSDSNRYFVFNVNGEEKTYSANEIASIIAESQIEKELSKINYDEAAENILSKIQESLSVDKETADQIIQAIRNKDYNSLDEETIKKIEEASIKEEILSKEELESIGLEAGKGLLEGLDTAVDQWDPTKAREKQKEKIKSLYSTVAKATGESEDTIKSLVNEMKKLSENANATEEDLIKLAKTAIIFNNNLQKLADSFSDNEEILKEWQSSTGDMSVKTAKAVGDLKEKFDDLFDADVSIDFLKDNLGDIEAMLNGDTEALNRLEAALGKQYILSIDDGQLAAAFNQAESAFDELANTDLVIGAVFDDEEALAEIQNFFNSAKVSQDKAQAILNQYGYEGELEEIKEPDTTRTTYDEVTDVTYTPVTSRPGSMPVLDGTNGYKMQPLPPFTTYAPNYSTRLVPHTETIPGKSYWVLKSKDGKGSADSGGKTTGLVGSVKSLGTGRARKKTTSNFSGYTPNAGKSGSGSRGGGGGGNSESSKEPDVMEALESENDRYHDVDIRLKQISTDLNKLDKQKKKLFGQDLITNLNKRLNLLNKQIDRTNEKIKIAQGETQELRNKLGAKGVSFNADGTIANYAAAYASQLKYVNSLINQYNHMSATAQESFKDTVEKAKEDFDKFVDNINRYDELVTDMIPDLEADIQEAIDEKIDIQIEKFDMEIEIRLHLAEAERDWNEFKKKIIDGIEDDDILGNAMARLVDFSSYYKEDNTGIVQALTKQVNDILSELNVLNRGGVSSIYGDNKNALLEDLEKYMTELRSNITDVFELQKAQHEAYMDMMDEAQEKFDEQIESYEMISDLIEHDMQVISLVYGDEAYGRLAKYYNKQEQNLNKQLDFQQQQVVFWEQQLNTLEKGSKEWENAKEKWANAIKDLNDLIEESIQNLQDKYLNTINLIFQDLNNKVTNGLGLDYIEEEWNLINKHTDEYLDDINSIYEIQKLENKYLKSLDDIDSLSMRKQLKDLMEAELEDLRERDKLTKYDVERANQRYEIALKQIALQEAQRNKTRMRLRRDSQGNYRYEYTSDSDQIGQLQDELNDMYNSLYNFDKSRYQENLNQIYSVWVEFQEKMAEAAQINDPTARKEKELLIETHYGELINGLVEQNTQIRNNLYDSAFEDLARLYKVNIDNYQNMTQEEKDLLMQDLIPQWDSGMQRMASAFAGEGGFVNICQDALAQLDEATKEYENGLTILEENGKTNFENIGSGIDNNIDKTQDLVIDNNKLIDSYRQQLKTMSDLIDELDNMIIRYGSLKDGIKAATKAQEAWVAAQRAAAAAASAGKSGSSSSSNTNTSSKTSSSSSSNSRSSGGDGNLVNGEVVTYSGRYYADSYGGGSSGSLYSGVARGVVVDRINNNPYGIHIHSADGRYPDLGWVRKSQLSGYDTGGYTGEWGGNGRLALLHQKELVLNKEDTANMLNAISIMRNITNMLGSSVLSKLAAATAGRIDTNNNNDVLEQNVHIDAQFPNVKNSREIEEALNNLVNMASMRANKR